MLSRGVARNSGADGCNQFLEELYRVRGELLDKAKSPDPTDPEVDCTLGLQISVAYSKGAVACFYPTPLERDVLDEEEALTYEDLADEGPRFTAMKSCNKATISIALLRKAFGRRQHFRQPLL